MPSIPVADQPVPAGAAVVSCRQAGLCRCGRHHGVPAHVVNTWPGTRCPCTACIRDRSRTILCPSSRRRASCLRQQRGHVSNECLALAPAPLPGRANRVHVNSQTCRPCVPFLKPCRHVTHTVRVRPEPAPVHVGGQGAGGRLYMVRRWKLFGCDRWSDGVDPSGCSSCATASAGLGVVDSRIDRAPCSTRRRRQLRVLVRVLIVVVHGGPPTSRFGESPC